MDDLVLAALKKWPNVPACRGWLGLDARGDWYLRDEAVQAAGPFPQVKGSRIGHPALAAFIARNYAADDRGAWYFQNGPQRVYVELDAAPWIWRVHDDGRALEPRVVSHTGQRATVDSAWQDERGRLFLGSDLGLGMVHTLDILDAAGAVERGVWRVDETSFDALVERFGVCLSPAASARPRA